MKKYIIFARQYLKYFVSEKEKYDDEKKRRDPGSRRSRQNSKDGGHHEELNQEQTSKSVPHNENSAQSPELYDAHKDMLARRRVLFDTLKARNVSIDKRPLMFELDDIDAQIAQITGKFGGTTV